MLGGGYAILLRALCGRGPMGAEMMPNIRRLSCRRISSARHQDRCAMIYRGFELTRVQKCIPRAKKISEPRECSCVNRTLDRTVRNNIKYRLKDNPRTLAMNSSAPNN